MPPLIHPTPQRSQFAVSKNICFSQYGIVGNIKACLSELQLAGYMLDQLMEIRQSKILRNTSTNKKDHLTKRDCCRKRIDRTRIQLRFIGSFNHSWRPLNKYYSGVLPPVAPYISPDI